MSCKVFLDALKKVSETVVKHNDPDVVIEMQEAIDDALTALECSSRKELLVALKRTFEVACRINDPGLATEVLKALDDAITKVQSGSW